MSVSQWRADHGVASDADFAFYFLTYEEALEEGGLDVAQAWAACHAAVGPGAAGAVRAVVANLHVPAPPSLRALGLPKVRPSSTPPWRPPPKVAPMPSKRPLPATTPLLTKNKAYWPFLEEILLTASVHREAFNRDSASKATTQPLVSKILSSHEPETLQRVAHTWAEIRDWSMAQGLPVHSLSPVDIALFVQSCKAPSRVLPALQFMARNLHYAVDLGLAKQLRTTAKSALGQGDKQAPVAQPVLLRRLEESLHNAITQHDPEWLALFGAWVMAMGCVRWEHIQRSRLLKVTAHTMVFECLRGKQRGRRAGFQWSCPRAAASLDADFGDAFIRAIAQQPLEFASIAFHAETGQELPSAVCRTKVQHVLAGVLHPEDIALLSGKSWRQVGVTWGFLAKLDATQVCALGNWLDTSEFKGNKMPWRYFRAKLQQSTMLKHMLHLSLRSLLVDHEVMTWQEVSQPLAASVLEAVEKGPLLEIDETGICFERVPLFSQFQEQVLLIQSGAFVGKQHASRQSAGPSSSAPPDAAMAVRVPDLPIEEVAPTMPKVAPKIKPMPKKPQPKPMASQPAAASSGSVRPKSPARPPAARDFDPDHYFDELARQRWSRPGHGNRPEPPTVIYHHRPGMHIPALILGGIPHPRDHDFFVQYNVGMVVTAMKETVGERGGSLPPRVKAFQWPISHFQRDKWGVHNAWSVLSSAVLPTLESGQSIYVHCLAGVHRAPPAAGVLHAMLAGGGLENSMVHIGALRAVEPVLLTENRNRQLATWLRSLTTRQSLPPCRVRLPVRFLCSKIGGGAWHAEGRTDDEEAVQPACRWKQAPSATKASFAGGVIRAVSIHEAVVYGRPWCKTCITLLPGRLQADLDTSAIEFK